MLLPGSVSWALIVVVGVCVQMQLLVVVHVHVCAQMVIVVDVDVGEGLVVILYICMHGWLVVIVGSCVCGGSCLWAVVSHCWRWLLRVVITVCCYALVVFRGSCCHLPMVVVRRKEATSHIVTMASHLNIHVRSHVRILPRILLVPWNQGGPRTLKITWGR